MTSEIDRPYGVRFHAAARRAISHRLPEPVDRAVIEVCATALADEPHRVGTALVGPLAGCHGARRGSYRIVYRIDEASRTVQVLDIAHRADVDRRH